MKNHLTQVLIVIIAVLFVLKRIFRNKEFVRNNDSWMSLAFLASLIGIFAIEFWLRYKTLSVIALVIGAGLLIKLIYDAVK